MRKIILLCFNKRKGTVTIMKKLATIDRRVCVACGVCVKTCPKGALSIFRGCYASVDEAKCVGCGLCLKACPAGCINVRERSEAK